MKTTKRFLTVLIVACAAISLNPAKSLAQQTWCAWSQWDGCCICDEDFWGHMLCYDQAIFGWHWCDSYVSFCELWDPGCIHFPADALAPDGSLYFARSGVDDQQRGPTPRTILVAAGSEWDVVCTGAIVKRRYTEAALAAIEERLRFLSL